MGEALTVETWPEVFERAGALHFRKQVPHILRARPDAGTDPVTTIGLDHELELLETRGDWMRVQVFQPTKSCTSPGVAGNGPRRLGAMEGSRKRSLGLVLHSRLLTFYPRPRRALVSHTLRGGCRDPWPINS